MTHQYPELKNIERAVGYIQAELAEDRVPALDDLAKAAGLSKFHFHRIYKLITGETCTQTITRLRLAKAAYALQHASTSITQAAFAAGYGSGQAFAKAIKRELSASASEIRSDPERLAETVRTLIKPSEIASEQTPPYLQIEIASLEPLEVLLIRTEDIYPNLVETYGFLFELAGGPQNVKAVLGLPQRDIETQEDGAFGFHSALLPFTPVKHTSDDVMSKVLPAQLYLLARHTGLDADLPVTLDVLYTHILMCPEIDFADVSCIHHYIDDPEEIEEAICRTDIYVPITVEANP